MARRLTVSAKIDGVDHETFGPNEYGHAEQTRETIIADSQPQSVIRMECKWGGECRVELDLVGQQRDDGQIKITGVAKLFEGISEDTDDLDGWESIDDLIPRGRNLSRHYQVKNKDEGGDYADIHITYNNSLVEE